MLIPCLQKGIIPDVTITVDGNRELIVKWYDHDLVRKYGKQLKICLITSVANNVLKVCRKAECQIYWYHPLFDDYRQNESFSRLQKYITATKQNPEGAPLLQCGGHAGGAAWVLAWSVFKRSPVALIGIDLGYLENTPIEQTAYYEALFKATGGNIAEIMKSFREEYNPLFKTKAITDPIFYHYKISFLEMIAESPWWLKTVSCVEGGTLYGQGIEGMRFKQFLETYVK